MDVTINEKRWINVTISYDYIGVRTGLKFF